MATTTTGKKEETTTMTTNQSTARKNIQHIRNSRIRKLNAEAETSMRQAEAYENLAKEATRFAEAAPDDSVEAETYRHEAARLHELIDEFHEDADDRIRQAMELEDAS